MLLRIEPSLPASKTLGEVNGKFALQSVTGLKNVTAILLLLRRVVEIKWQACRIHVVRRR